MPIEDLQPEPAPPRRSGQTAGAPAPVHLAAQLTRAELRRRTQAEAPSPAAAPLTRRSARSIAGQPPAAALTGDVRESTGERGPAEVPEVPAAALEVPHIPELPVVVETAAAAIEASPVTLLTPPLDLPAAPMRRIRNRAALEREDLEQVFELGEPLTAASGAAAPFDGLAADAPSGRDEIPTFDEFEAAAKLFSFTGETPVQVAATAFADGERDADSAEPSTAPRRRFPFRRAAAASFSVGVMGVIGLLTVGMTTPPAAVAAAQGTAAPVAGLLAAGGDVPAAHEEIQAYIAPAQAQNGALERSDSFGTTTLAQIAADSGIANFSSFFVNDPTSPIQWPFAVGVPITYGFGMRSGTMHEGADFVPGAGAPVQAIADGTVRIATESGGAFGVTVVIDHVIDGGLVSSRYAHMQYGSLQVKVGEHVTVGTVIGHTGNTGRSYGAHTHFEILAGGTTPIDPIPWLRAHAGG